MDVREDNRRVMGGVFQEAGSEVRLMASIVFWNTEKPTTRRLFHISLCVLLDNNSALVYFIL